MQSNSLSWRNITSAAALSATTSPLPDKVSVSDDLTSRLGNQPRTQYTMPQIDAFPDSRLSGISQRPCKTLPVRVLWVSR